MLVLDASTVVDLLLDVEPTPSVVWPRLIATDAAGAPHLLDAEVGQVMRRFVLRGDLTAQRAREALDDLQSMPIERYPHAPLMPRAFELRRNVTFYDALYLALAELLEAPLVTRDRGLRGLPGVRITVEVI